MIDILCAGSYKEQSIMQMERYGRQIQKYINQENTEDTRQYINRIELIKSIMRGCDNWEEILNNNMTLRELKLYTRKLLCDGAEYSMLSSLEKLAIDKGMHLSQFKPYKYNDDILMEIISGYEYNINLEDYIEKYNLTDVNALHYILKYKIRNIDLDEYIGKVDNAKLNPIGNIILNRPHLADKLNNKFSIEQLNYISSVVSKQDFTDDIVDNKLTVNEMDSLYIYKDKVLNL